MNGFMRHWWCMAVMLSFGLPGSVLASNDDLGAALERGRAELEALGVSAAVIRSDGTLWQGTAGEAAAGVSLTADAAFQIGSITKIYTAALVLRMVERGEIELRGLGVQRPIRLERGRRPHPRRLTSPQ